MTDGSIQLVDTATLANEYRNVSLRWWFVAFAMILLSGAGALALLLRREPLSLAGWEAFQTSVASACPAIKLLVFGLYLMVSCTFLPLFTGWIVAAVAMETTSVTGQLWTTVLLVGGVGALASTLANLNDYHLFTLLLRSRRIVRIRHTRTYDLAARWFARAPFALLLVFNLLPIPVDIARMLAASHRYDRGAFVAANFLGRFLRYGIIAYVTYRLAGRGYVAVLVLLGLAMVLGLGRLGLGALRRMREKGDSMKRQASLVILTAALLATACGESTLNASSGSGEAPAADTAPDAKAILDRLEEAGRTYAALRAKVRYEVVNRMTGEREVRTGWVAYQKATDTAPAKFRVFFETLQLEDGAPFREKVDYIFDGYYVTKDQYKTKTRTRWQVAAKGERIEALKIGKGPFPVPFGQTKSDVLTYLRARVRPAEKDDPPHTDALTLTPRPGKETDVNFVRLEMWVDRKTDLPVKLRARDENKNIKTVVFEDIQTRAKIDPSLFAKPKPFGFELIVKRLDE